MIEKVKPITNPLTIIAIFAGLAEIAGTILAAIDKSLQSTFIWFVMGFPILLVLLFFATLNFNPKVLYSPSDFKNEDNFLNLLAVGTHNVSVSLEQTTKQLNQARQEILQQALEGIAKVDVEEREKFFKIVNQQINGIEDHLSSVRREADSVTTDTLSYINSREYIYTQILKMLANESEPKTINQIGVVLGYSEPTIYSALHRLVEQSLVSRMKKDTHYFYTITDAGRLVIKSQQ